MKTHHLLPAIIFCITLFGYQSVNSQNVAINTTGNAPDASSILDVQSSSKGLLIPQISLVSLSDAATIATPAHSLLVYNTNAAVTGGKGYYFNSGTTLAPVWVKLTTTNDLLTMTTIGATPNANGGSISSGVLSLQPASASFGGVVTTGTQTFAGAKTFTGDLTPGGRLMLPMGEISYFNTTGGNITITNQSDGSTNMVQCNVATTLANDMEFDNGGSNNGTLRYVGTTTRTFHVACTISLSQTSASSNATFVFGVAKNGTVVTSSKVLQRFTNSTSDIQSTALHVMVTLAPNEYLQFYVGNTSGTGDITIKALNLFALGM